MCTIDFPLMETNWDSRYDTGGQADKVDWN